MKFMDLHQILKKNEEKDEEFQKEIKKNLGFKFKDVLGKIVIKIPLFSIKFFPKDFPHRQSRDFRIFSKEFPSQRESSSNFFRKIQFLSRFRTTSFRNSKHETTSQKDYKISL